MLVKIGFRTETAPLERVGEAVEGIKHRLDALALYEVGKHLVEMAEQFGRTAEQINISAVAAGLSAEQFQALSFSAMQSGISAERFNRSLIFLSRNLGAAKQGSKQAQENFERIGITKEQLKGFATSKDALMAMADAINNIQDPSERATAAVRLLGRGGASLLKYMNQGSQGIAGMIGKAKQIGAVVSAKTLDNLEEATDSLEGLHLVVRGFWMEALGNLAPGIKGVVSALEKWIGANRQLFLQNIQDYANRFAYLLGLIVGAIQIVMEKIGSWMGKNKDLFQNLKDLGPKAVEAFAGFAVIATITTNLLALNEATKHFIGGFGLFSGPLNVIKSLAKWAGGLLLTFSGFVLSRGLLHLAVWLEGLSPLLSEAAFAASAFIAALGPGQILALATAIVVAYEALKTLWEMFAQGKSWRQTSLAKDLDWMLDKLDELAKKFTLLKTPIGWFRHAIGLDKEKTDAAAMLAAQIPSGDIQQVQSGIASISGTQIPDAAKGVLPEWARVAGNSTVNQAMSPVNIQTTVNVNGQIDADKFARQLTQNQNDMIRERDERNRREAYRSLNPAMSM